LGPLDLATLAGHRECAEILSDRGAIPATMNENEAELEERIKSLHMKPLLRLGIRVGVLLNARGKVCLIHDEKFKAGSPIWLRYHRASRAMELLFDNSTGGFIALPPVDDALHAAIVATAKVLIVRMRCLVPFESWDTHVIFEE
jgi:hypothetical protein